ncbi:hypothetical protein C8Q76DRAFT_149371 [Earliella scabrosa]|nr:hypothetical protein C8Q76DRAFT_149371 [Earliella scabrosa]
MSSRSSIQDDVCTRSLQLLLLPAELQIRILQGLSGKDLLACQKVCALWGALIGDTTELQYAIALAFSGMTDGTLGDGMPTCERFQVLKTYQAAWNTGEQLCRMLVIPTGWRLIETACDTFVYAQRGGSALRLHRPASLFSGVPEKSWTIDLAREHIASDDTRPNVSAVDVGQDLLVVMVLESGFYPQCHLLSLSQNGTPHPLARQSVLRGHSEVNHFLEYIDHADIVDSLIAWMAVFDADVQMHVHNWKTGELLWYYDSSEDNSFIYSHNPSCHILNSSYVMKIVAASIYVHQLRAGCSTGSPAICQFQLPQLSRGFTTGWLSEHYVQRPPVYTDCAPHFEGDPDITLLVMKYTVDHPPGHDCGSTTVVVFIPLLTILEAVRRIHHSDVVEPRIVSWNEWTTHGSAQLVILPRARVVNISTMGSRAALIFQPTPISSDSVATSQEIFLFDAHPHAARNESAIVGSGSSAPRWISDTYTAAETPIFKGPVYSTLPYRFTRMQIPHTTGFREQKVYLTHDGLFTY